MEARTTNSPRISSPFVTTSWPKTTADEPLPTLEVDASGALKLPTTTLQRAKATKQLGERVRTTKIKLQPQTSEDSERLRRNFGAVRWTYNQAVAAKKDAGTVSRKEATLDPKTNNPISWKKFLRHEFVATNSPAVTQNPWLKDVSYDIRDAAVVEYLTSESTAMARMKNGDIKSFDMKFKSRKKCRSESLYFRARWIEVHDNHVILKWPNQKPMKLWTGKNKFRGKIAMDCRLQRMSTNEYYLCVPQSYEHPNNRLNGVASLDNQEAVNMKVCSLDPGVRTFQTIYDPSRSRVVEVGPNDMARIVRICKELDKLMSRISAAKKSKQRCNMRRAAKRLRLRIQSLVREVHCQLAVFLTREYDIIMLPKFDTSQMVKKASRKIGSKSTRMMTTWSHYRFRERLAFKCRERGSKLVIVNEAWTSKTCSNCGTLKHNLGASKLFHCVNCNHVFDRDINGAKNIFIKNYQALGLEISGPSFGAYPLSNRNIGLHGTSNGFANS